MDENETGSVMKIVFLDIDGVIAITPTFRKSWKYARRYRKSRKLSRFIRDEKQLSRKVVKQLNKLVMATGCKFVISSSWRYGTTQKMFKRLFRRKKFIGEIIGEIPHILMHYDSNFERAEEIKYWLEWNKNEIESFLVIDDDSFDIIPVFPANYIQTEIDKGFQGEEMLQKAIEILNKGVK